MKKSKQNNFIIGIDEAGRGPLAGPVAVGAVKISNKFNKKFFKDIRDSKKLSAEERELWFELTKVARKKFDLDFSVSLISEKIIDKHGISYAIKLGIKRCIKKLKVKKSDQIFLDGSLSAPIEFPHQLTVVKGDEKIPVISLASICAKVLRDKYMTKLSLKYPDYMFHIHKGYGTRLHKEEIRKKGASLVHRKSFLKNII